MKTLVKSIRKILGVYERFRGYAINAVRYIYKPYMTVKELYRMTKAFGFDFDFRITPQ